MSKPRWVWKETAEVVGVLGVIASLIFVGMEIRQSSVATQASTNASLADGFRQLNLAIATDRELAEALSVNPAELETIPPAIRAQVVSFWRSVFQTWSNAYRQQLSGTLDPMLYESVISEITTYAHGGTDGDSRDYIEARGRAMRYAWEREKFLFPRDFQNFLDGMLEAQEPRTH